MYQEIAAGKAISYKKDSCLVIIVMSNLM